MNYLTQFSLHNPSQAIVEAKSTHPVADNRSDSFARTPHFASTCESALNEQINIEYNVSYIYHAMYAYFARDNVYLPGIAAHFLKESLEERSHAELLMNYQIMRGGRVELQAIMPPQVEYDHPEKGDALYAFELSLSLEKLNNDRLISLHRIAGEADDANMQDFIEGQLLEDQVKSIEEVSRFVGQLRRLGNKGDAVWHFDQAMLENV
jgi:ferritin heavy chain|tara:strand:- start:139 stop:762 length:624 start_codon:yes stop_codon:yes gene_type:complete